MKKPVKNNKWDNVLGFMLFAIGMSQVEIARKFGVSPATVCIRAKLDKWEDRKTQVLLERQNRVDKNLTGEQKFIKANECDMSRRLLGLGHEMLRTLKRSEKTDVADLCRVLELASTLGRRSTGMPMGAVEMQMTHDLSADMNEAIKRIYGTDDQTKAIQPGAGSDNDQFNAPIDSTLTLQVEAQTTITDVPYIPAAESGKA